jgi:beta-glucosidase/6-phospho-beta-glucosidase/beta-galactosidase
MQATDGKGFNTPGYVDDETYEDTISHTVLVVHGKAAQAFRALQNEGRVVPSTARIGIVLATNFYYPLDASSVRGAEATD